MLTPHTIVLGHCNDYHLKNGNIIYRPSAHILGPSGNNHKDDLWGRHRYKKEPQMSCYNQTIYLVSIFVLLLRVVDAHATRKLQDSEHLQQLIGKKQPA